MTLITFQDGKPVLRDGKVGTEQACCCGECGCALREGHSIVVAVDGQDVTADWPGCASGICYGPDGVILGSSGATFYADPDYCESTLICSREVSIAGGCYNASEWDNDFFPYGIPGSNTTVVKPSNWPSKGVVIAVTTYWYSRSSFPECTDNGCSAGRLMLYSMNCDGEGYPSTGTLFYDSGATTAIPCTEPLTPCFDCPEAPSFNRDCEGTPLPTSVQSVENPLP